MMEADLVTVLKTCCPRVYPDFAPAGAALPYVVYQHIGGIPQRYVDGGSGLRHTMLQINSWATTRGDSLTLARAIETALCAATAFTAKPDSEPIGDLDDDTERRGSMQDFSVWSART